MRVATLNVRHRLPVAKFRADVTRVLKESPDFLGLQECSGKDRQQALTALTAGGTWLAVNDAPHQTPIVVDAEKKRVLDHGVRKLTDRLKPNATTGAGTATKKHAAWVLVEDRATKRREAYVNCHLVPSLWFPPRSRLHRRQVAALAELVRDLFKRADDVYVTGDFNAPLKRLGPLRKAGLKHATTVASHGRRSIDHILSNRPLEAQRTLDGLHTDHRAVVADFKEAKPVAKKTITQRVAANARQRGLTVLGRKAWGSRNRDIYAWRRSHKPHGLLPGRPVDTVWQHITVTRPSGNFADDCRTVERIGMERFGSGVSYNWLVDMATGQVAVGQPLDAKGTHTIMDKPHPNYSHDQNAVSIAIAVIGMPDTRLTVKGQQAISKLIAAHIDEGAVTEGFDYNPHSFAAHKDCPCEPTRRVMPLIRSDAIKEAKK